MRKNLEQVRNEYKQGALDESHLAASPFLQLQAWLDEAFAAKLTEPTAFTFISVGANGQPSGRTVLLKQLDEQGLVFYTNYQSRKASEMELHPQVAALFFWPPLERQVRIEGKVEQVPASMSDAYFARRPVKSQLAAWTSQQSRQVNSRKALEKRFAHYEKEFLGKTIPRPPHWGGYRIVPHYFEFWQGRRSRLHDRLVYRPGNQAWIIERLSP